MSEPQDPLLEELKLLRQDCNRLLYAGLVVCGVAIAVLILAILK